MCILVYPLNDRSNIHNYIKRHEVLSFHTSSQQTATHFLDVKSKTSTTESITSMLSSQQKEDIARNRHIVKEIIDVLILCGHQNIAIREGEGGSYRRRKKFYVNFASCVQARRNTAVPNSMIN